MFPKSFFFTSLMLVSSVFGADEEVLFFENFSGENINGWDWYESVNTAKFPDDKYYGAFIGGTTNIDGQTCNENSSNGSISCKLHGVPQFIGAENGWVTLSTPHREYHATLLAGDENWTDIAVESKIMMVDPAPSCPGDSEEWRCNYAFAGIYGRVQVKGPIHNVKQTRLLQQEQNLNYYGFWFVKRNSGIHLVKILDGDLKGNDWASQMSNKTLVSKEGFSYPSNKFIKMRLEITGDASSGVLLKGYLDGKKVLEYLDTGVGGPVIENGKIGLWEFETHAIFDDVKVVNLGVNSGNSAPFRSDGSPSGTIKTTSPTLSLNTNKNATCKYSENSGTDFSAMTKTFSSTGGKKHSQNLSGLSDGFYDFYIRCKSSDGTANSSDFNISFSIDIHPPPPPRNLSVSASGATVNLSWSASGGDAENFKIYRNGAKIGETSSTQYSDLSTSPQTSYSYQVSSVDSAGNESGKSNSVSITTGKALPILAKINFQTSDTPAPENYRVDSGEVFDSSRGYGWKASAVGDARDRNAISDQKLDTLIHLQTKRDSNSWEYALPNGKYQITVSVGDPNYTNSVHQINLEGSAVISGFAPSNGNLFRQATAEVDVSDGRLTVDAIGGKNTKINYLIIVTADSSSPPPSPPSGLHAEIQW